MSDKVDIFEIGSGFTSVPPKIGAATETVIENLTISLSSTNNTMLIDIKDPDRLPISCPIEEINMPKWAIKPASFLSFKHKAKRILYSINLAFRIKKLIKKYPKAIFHFHNQYNFYFTYKWVYLLRKKKYENCLIYTLHTPLWSENIDVIKEFAPKRYFAEAFAIKKADIVISLNPKIKENIQNYIQEPIDGCIITIPNGVNTSVYYPTDSRKDKNTGLTFVNIGSVCDRKNQLETIKMLTPILQKENSCFIFAGAIADEEYMNHIKSYIKENNLENSVTYLGEIPPGEAMNSVYNKADIYISHSKSEAFSLVVLEAMAAGLPAMLSQSFHMSIDSMPLSEALIVCDTDDDFYKKITYLQGNNQLLGDLKTESVSYIQKYYTWKKIADQHRNAFSQYYSK